MSLIGNIDNIPVFTSIAEAELWGSQYNLTPTPQKIYKFAKEV